MRLLAISDIHGHAYTFKALLKQLELEKSDLLLLLGDYIDRGPNSKQVIDHILDLEDKGYQVVALKGNHEDMMIKALTDTRWMDLFLKNGGSSTLQSFGLSYDLNKIPKLYWDYLENLPLYHKVDDFLFVHAGFNFKALDPFEDEEAMLWERYWYNKIDFQWLGNKKIIHGHTPIGRKDIESNFLLFNKVKYLNIDAGCFRFGELCAVDLTNDRLYFQENLD